MWYIYTMECYSAVNNHDIVKLLGKWVDLEKKIILSVVAQTRNMVYSHLVAVK